ALHRLIGEFDLTHQQTAEAVGRSRASVSNLLRLLELHDTAKEFLEKGLLDMGHARALLTLDEALQRKAALEIVSKKLSVRETEALVRKLQEPPKEKQSTPAVDPDITRLEQDLSDKLCTSVSVKHQSSGKGQLVIKYGNLDELDGILGKIK
ncbi:MAG: ParB/RepB/Spo0J family partition protein, partial [bacterium]